MDTDYDFTGDSYNNAYENTASQPIEIRNLLTEGDELLIRDYNTGYDWLKFSETEGLSTEEIAQLLAANDTYQGFQIATANQVEEFIVNYLRGAGIRLLPHQIFVHSDELNDGLKTLGSLLGGEGYIFLTFGSNLGGIAFHRQFVGIVRDTPVESDSNPDRRSVVSFSVFYPEESDGALSSSVKRLRFTWDPSISPK